MTPVYITFYVTTKEYSRRRQKMTFESLLVKELQKQQSRAEFCDVVLHTQGVSVPVHSCVLSAFSPWLCGALAVMPSPEKQKRLIEVQAVEACTLLSLVTLLYSGQLSEEKEEVLSAACKLGITIPQKDITATVSQAGTQTEYMKESVERECQTEVHYTSTLSLLSECPHPKEMVETVNLIGLSSWRSDQGLDQYATASDITLTTLQNVQGIPEKLSSFQVMDVVPETSMYPTVSAPACAPQGYVCPPECSTAALPPHPYLPYSTSQGQSALCGVSRCEEYDSGGLEQFENNIPGFINYFLHANSTQAAEQRGQSQKGSRGDIKTEGKTKRAQRGRTQGNYAVRWEGGSIRKMEQNMHRFGRVAKSAWIGQGGGRVGRMLDTRHVLKHQGRFNRRQGRGTIYKVEGEKGRSSSRGRPRKRQAESRASFVEPVCQDQAPPTKRPRGRPRKHPLPPPNTARSGMPPPEEKATNPPALSLIHTAALPTANQPLDWLIDDVIAQLPFMPPITPSIQNNQTSVKVTDLCVVQSQPEGELTDILDSFLRTFDQHVGACDSDVRAGMSTGSQSNITDRTGAYQQSAQNYTVRIDASNTLSDMNTKKLKGQQSEKSETRRKTRSEGRKSILEPTEELRREVLPAKRRRRIEKEGLEKQGVEKSKKKQVKQPHSKKTCTSSKIDSRGNVAGALSKVIGKPSVCNVKCSAQSTKNIQKIMDQSSSSEFKRKKESKGVRNMISQPSQSTKKSFTGTHPKTALSALEFMKNLLENQRKRGDEQKKGKHIRRTAGRKREKEKTQVHKCVKRAELTRDGKRAQTSNQTTSQQTWPKGQRERLNSYSKATFGTVDSPGEYTSRGSDAMGCSTEGVIHTNVTADPAVPLEKPRDTQCITDTSEEEDVDVVEVSSTLSESSNVLPLVADIVISTEEEDDDEEEIDILDFT